MKKLLFILIGVLCLVGCTATQEYTPRDSHTSAISKATSDSLRKFLPEEYQKQLESGEKDSLFTQGKTEYIHMPSYVQANIHGIVHTKDKSFSYIDIHRYERSSRDKVLLFAFIITIGIFTIFGVMILLDWMFSAFYQIGRSD